jgi:serine/threonine-protein kinase
VTADEAALARVGSTINDKWTLERLLGMGGMSAVYAARHRNGARAAVKVLHLELSRNAQVRERFLREGYAANKVEHPGVVKVLDDDVITSGPDEGTAYLVMELLAGESLQERLDRGPPLTEVEFLRLACEVLDVLEAAHGRGVVHRDLKPENLFLARDEEAPDKKPRLKVLDFGLARLLDAQSHTGVGLALGTPSYMSPEQAAGRIQEIDGRTDLFALGATGLRLVFGRKVHEGANFIEIVTRMATIPAPLVQAVAPHASKPFADILDRALSFRREDRYPTAAAMRAEVDRALRTLEVGPAPIGTAKTVLAAREPTMQLSARDLEIVMDRREPSEAPTRRRRRSLIPWAVVALYGGIAAGLYYEERTPPASPPPSAPSVPLAASASAPPSVAPSSLVVDAVDAALDASDVRDDARAAIEIVDAGGVDSDIDAADDDEDDAAVEASTNTAADAGMDAGRAAPPSRSAPPPTPAPPKPPKKKRPR